ncbi:hypothetical protein GCM10027088_36970 [Nocardia goodfellowii]
MPPQQVAGGESAEIRTYQQDHHVEPAEIRTAQQATDGESAEIHTYQQDHPSSPLRSVPLNGTKA